MMSTPAAATVSVVHPFFRYSANPPSTPSSATHSDTSSSTPSTRTSARPSLSRAVTHPAGFSSEIMVAVAEMNSSGFGSVVQHGSTHGDSLTPQGFAANLAHRGRSAAGYIGIGAATTMYGVMQRLLVRPPPHVAAPEREVVRAGLGTQRRRRSLVGRPQAHRCYCRIGALPACVCHWLALQNKRQKNHRALLRLPRQVCLALVIAMQFAWVVVQLNFAAILNR